MRHRRPASGAVKTLAREGDKAEIVQRLTRLRPDSVRRWGRMTAHQMVCHLADSFRVAMGDFPVNLDTNLLKRTMLKWVVLYVPLRWPPGILTAPELDQVGGRGTLPVDFAADLARLIALVDAFTAPTRRPGGQPHSFFGRMSDAAWLRWGWLHTDHHLRQFGT